MSSTLIFSYIFLLSNSLFHYSSGGVYQFICHCLWSIITKYISSVFFYKLYHSHIIEMSLYWILWIESVCQWITFAKILVQSHMEVLYNNFGLVLLPQLWVWGVNRCLFVDLLMTIPSLIVLRNVYSIFISLMNL